MTTERDANAESGQVAHVRHKPPTPLGRPRELVLVCAPLRSNVNLSNIVRTAGCCGVTRLIACGSAKPLCASQKKLLTATSAVAR